MASEHSPLYKSIAEQLTAYIDLAVTEPMENWSPPWTLQEDELPMEVLYDYDLAFPLPDGLEDILSAAKISEEHKATIEKVWCDLLGPKAKFASPPYLISELRLAYRSNVHDSICDWTIRSPTPFEFNYVLLSRAEKAINSRRKHPQALIQNLDTAGLDSLDGIETLLAGLRGGNPPGIRTVQDHWRTVQEKRLPECIGDKVHARLVDVKSRLDAVGLGNLLGLAL